MPLPLARIGFLILAAASLGSCDSPSTSSGRNGAMHIAAPASDRQAPSLLGTWQIAAVDGEPVMHVPLRFSEEVVWWEPSCAGWLRPYTRSNHAIRIEPPEPSAEPRVVCDVGYPNAVPAAFGLLPRLTRIEEAGPGQVRLTGNGHVLKLERPLPAEQWPVPTLAGRWRVVERDGRSTDPRSFILKASDHTIGWEVSCARQVRSYTIENTRFAAAKLPRNISPPLPPGALAPVVRPICAIGLPPGLEEGLAAVDAATQISRLDNGAVVLQGQGRSVTLEPVKESSTPLAKLM